MLRMMDAQAGLGFLLSQTAHIERQVWEKKYPEITYPEFVPVDNTANEWATTVTYFSSDRAGKMERFHHRSRDIPKVDLTREKHETEVVMHAIGYDYTLEELNHARMVGINLTADKGVAARRAYEESVEDIAYIGDADHAGILNSDSTVSHAAVADGAGAADTTWPTKTPDEILADINGLITGIWTSSNTIEMADTILLPNSRYSHIATRRLDVTSETTILEHIQRVNIYKQQTGRDLKIRGLRQLETLGEGGTKRMVAYKRDPEVVKLHIPMTLKFLPAQGPYILTYEVPGICRIGYVDIRRPGAFRYGDNI